MGEGKKYPVQFYGGYLGAWSCLILAIAGIMYMLLIRGGGTKSIMVALFVSLVLGLVLAKDKVGYGDEMLKGLKESMVTTICMAFFMAGLLSALLKSCGLIQALLWAVGETHTPISLLPLVAFLVCVVISTACGTSTGTVTAVSAVMCPIGAELGINMGLMCGAIISGSIFGDNLAPISDTTIASSQTQGANLRDVVRSRLPYSLLAAGISAVLYVYCGLTMISGSAVQFANNAQYAKSLVFLAIPVVLIYLMHKGWGLVSSLLLANTMAVALCLVLGVIPVGKMFSDKSPIVTGMASMANVAIISFLMLMMLQIPVMCGGFDAFAGWLMQKCSKIRDAELIAYFASVFGVIATHSSTNTILFFGPFVKKLMDGYKEQADGCRSANILDGVACGTNGLIPYGNPMLVITGVCAGLPGVSDTFSFLDIAPYTYHCWGLLLIFLLSILTGVGRKRSQFSK